MFERIAGNVGGRIRDKRGDLGWENAALGYPVTDELTTPDRKGKYNHFQSGSIYYSPAGGVRTVSGKIRDFWAKAGWEKSSLGFPSSDPYTAGGGTKLHRRRHPSVRTHRCSPRKVRQQGLLQLPAGLPPFRERRPSSLARRARTANLSRTWTSTSR
ncbi:LGFP repeat-containing protein [Corynebacterium ureicelerivorans]|uniref:LGFP repeat-containing protein n=1 Tax=Corynebacterium ureicelerivorans TaxID=401472 RepID=UPI00235778C2|nr:hypothetical protein [Corynebacterium ureicelerivorans]